MEKEGSGIMGIRLFILFCFGSNFIFGSNSYYMPTENQLKFSVNDSIPFKDFIENSETIDDFQMHFHSLDTYFDLYIDTPEWDLYKNGFSLRFRKRISQLDSTYVFQLKREKTILAENRMEIDQEDLNIYSVKINKDWKGLTNVLDELFRSISNKRKIQSLLFGISNWMNEKYEAPIAPFQALRFLLDENDEFHFNDLVPVLIGNSLRWRSHVFYQNEAMDCNDSRKTKSDLPIYFQEHPSCWLLETSFDQSYFIPLFDSKVEAIDLMEFEVEVKFSDAFIGQAILNDFSESILNKFKLNPVLKSKYYQSITVFNASIPRN